LKKYEIIKKNSEFDDIIKTGAYLKNKYYYIYYKDSSFLYPKFGLAVSKKIGNAVERNKMKRQLRNIIDQNKKLFVGYYKYIIMVRSDILLTTYEEMEHNLVNLIKRGNMNEKI